MTNRDSLSFRQLLVPLTLVRRLLARFASITNYLLMTPLEW